MKNEILNGFYTNLLKDVGVRDNNSDGLLSYHREELGDDINVSIGGKRLALPTRANLKLGTDKLIMFHPASEQLMSGPSPVLDAFREYVMLRVSEAAKAIAGASLLIATDVKLQKKVKGFGNEILKTLTNADEKMIETLDKVMSNTGLSPDNRVYNIFLVSSGSKDKPRGLRTAKVSYPIMDDAFSDDPTEFFGVKMPRKTRDKPAIVGMLSIILGIEEGKNNQIDDYTSELREAPYFHSLLTAFYEISSHQNAIIKSLKTAVPQLTELEYEHGWVEEYEDFSNFIKKVGHAVPLLPGNAGKSTSLEDDEEDDKLTKTSWKDIRDDLPEEEEIRETRSTRKETKEPTSGWRALLKTSRDDDRNSGISFGRDRRRDRRGGFDTMVERDDDRRDRRDRRERDYGGHKSYQSRSWRDIYK